MSKINTPAMEKAAIVAKKRPKKTGFVQEAWFRLCHNKGAVVGMIMLLILVFLAIFPDQIAPYGEDEQNYSVALMAPCKEYPLGTDNFGRDILSRIIYGTRVSLLIGIVSVAMAMVVGGTLGLVAAYYGGKIDDLIMRIMDIFYSMPSFLLAIAIAAALGSGMFNLMIAIAVGQIPAFSRIVRAAALTVKGNEFIEASTAIGSSTSRILFKHILPNASAPIIVHATLSIASAILSAAGLSFVGIGVQPPTAEWGSMLNAGKSYIRTNWNIITFPGIIIMLTIYALNLFGDGLRDALDPKLKK